MIHNISIKRVASFGNPLLIFSVPVFLFFLADGLVAFMLPIIIETEVSSNTVLGLILSASSIVGLVCDLIFPALFKEKTWRFQIISGILLSFLVPITVAVATTLAPVVLFLLASAIWGMYYEFLLFSVSNFIVDEEKKENYLHGWGVILAIIYISSIVSPIMASLLLNLDVSVAMAIIMSVQAITLITALSASTSIRNRKRQNLKSRTKQTFNLLKELLSWEALAERTYSIIVVELLLNMISASYWIIGGLLAAEMFGREEFDWVPLILYIVPATIGSILWSRIRITSGKKRWSQSFLVVGGILLTMVLFNADNVPTIIALMLLSSFCFAMSRPLNSAVFSDLLIRLGKDNKEDLIGLQNASSSIAFIIAPIGIGLLSDATNYLTTFAFMGAISVIGGCILILKSPRKLKVPTTRLEEIEKRY